MILGADIGGTHARLVAANRPFDLAQGDDAARCDFFNVAEFPSLVHLIDAFLERHRNARLEALAIASAGMVLDGTVTARNLPWSVDANELERSYGLRPLIVNDFAAMAYALPYVDRAKFRIINGPPPVFTEQPVLVVGPGTGLGAAVVRLEDAQPVVLPSEAGQAILAPATLAQQALWQVMQTERRPLRLEDVLSGPGLLRLARAVACLREMPSPYREPEAVTRAALARNDPIAVEALEAFCGFLGSACSQLALHHGSAGGVIIAGGIVPHIFDFLAASAFLKHFQEHPTMSDFLSHVSVAVIDHGRNAALGAVLWYLNSREDPATACALTGVRA